MEEVGLEKDAEEALELEKERRDKGLSKELTCSPKKAEGHLKRDMRSEWPVQPGRGGPVNSHSVLFCILAVSGVTQQTLNKVVCQVVLETGSTVWERSEEEAIRSGRWGPIKSNCLGKEYVF